MNACGLKDFIFEIIIELIKLWLVMCGLNSFNLTSDKRKYFLVSIVTVLSVTGLFFCEFMNPVSLSILSIIIFCIVIKGKNKILWTFMSYIVICSVDEVCIFVMTNLVLKSGKQNDVLLNSYGLMLFVIISIIRHFINKIRNRKTDDHYHEQINPAVLFLFNILIFIFVSQYNISDKIQPDNLFFTMIVVIFIASEIVVFYYMKRKTYYKNISELNMKLLNFIEQYYNSLLERENETRMFRHDIRNHLICIDTLLKSENYKEASEYIKNINESVLNNKSGIETGNALLNAVVGDLKGRYPDVSVKWLGHFPNKVKISNFDLCTIFSNLLGNAFENSQSKEKDPNVSVTVKSNSGALCVIIENDFAGSVRKKNGIFITGKKDASNHGIGLQNVNRCVKENNGRIDYRHSDNKFTVEILLPDAISFG